MVVVMMLMMMMMMIIIIIIKIQRYELKTSNGLRGLSRRIFRASSR
jgi:hypothetical protein